MNVRAVIRKFVRNPYLDLVLGIVLIFSGLLEVWETLPSDFSDFRLGVHHGIFLLGLVTLLRSVADIFAGMEFFDKLDEAKKNLR